MPVAVPLAVAAAGAAASAYGSHKQAKAQENAAKSQADLYNQWLAQRNSTANDITSKLMGSGWNPYGVNTLQSGGTSNTSSYQKTNPFITEQYKPLEGMMRGILENRLAQGSSLPQGYEANAIMNANKAYQGAAAAANNLAARHGLSGQQAFTAAAPFETARAGQISNIRAQTPLLERQMRNEDLGLASGAIGQFGKGEEARTKSTTTQSGWNQVAPNMSELANFYLPAGPQQTTVSPYSGSGSALSSLGGSGMSLAMLLGQMQAKKQNPYANAPYGGGWNVPGGWAPMPGDPGFPVITGQEDLGPYGNP